MIISKLPHYTFLVRKLIFNDKTGDWCKIPYPGHKNGCPNYNKSIKCPPQSPLIQNYFDLSKPLYLVHSEFDLSEHQEKMKNLHNDWSERQCRCVLYWQPKSRKQLKERVIRAMKRTNSNYFAFIPEAMGVNVYATARLSGLQLERIKDLKICRHVALIGTKISK